MTFGSLFGLLFPIPENEVIEAQKRPFGSSQRTSGTFVIIDFSSDLLRSSLLFQAALTFSAKMATKVTIVTKSPYQSLPVPVRKMPEANFRNLSGLNFVYPKSYSEFCLYLSTLGASAFKNGLMIVDGLEDFLPEIDPEFEALDEDDDLEDKHFTKLLALLRNLVDLNEHCDVIVSLKSPIENDEKLLFFADEVFSESELQNGHLVSNEAQAVEFGLEEGQIIFRQLKKS